MSRLGRLKESLFLNDDRRSGQMVLTKGVPDRHDADVCEPCGSSKSFLDPGLPSHPLMDDEGSLANVTPKILAT